MPLCHTLPDSPCSKRQNDGNVKLGESDLMLCCDCDQEHFKDFCVLQEKSVDVKSVSNNELNGDSKDAKDESATDTVSTPASNTVLAVNELELQVAVAFEVG